MSTENDTTKTREDGGDCLKRLVRDIYVTKTSVYGQEHPCDEAVMSNSDGWDRKWIVRDVNVFEFVKSHGDCVIRVNKDNSVNVEIYDDYRE